MEHTLFDLDRRADAKPRDFESSVGEFVTGVIRSVDADMRHQPASMVYEILRVSVERRLPGIEVDQEQLREAAARIAAGVPV